jgi:hypothetical protein
MDLQKCFEEIISKTFHNILQKSSLISIFLTKDDGAEPLFSDENNV